MKKNKKSRNGRPNAALRLDLILPVYNEEVALPKSCDTLVKYLESNCLYDWKIIIADNASTDRTPEIARSLSSGDARIHYLRLEKKGRGRALREAWLSSDADIVSYMDIDLSTDLKSYLPMINAIAHGDADIAIGTRFKRTSVIKRSLKREVLSRCFIMLIKLFFPRCGFSDAQCGFKAVSRHAVQLLVPKIKNQGWFFDTELLLLARYHGLKLCEIPIRWVEDPDSRVKIIRTGLEHSLGVLRMRLTFTTGVDLPEFYPHPIEVEKLA